jgi:hypothetical protein
MAIFRVVSDLIAWLRTQRWSREILLAVALTLASAIFIAAALMSDEAHVRGVPPFADANQ